MKLTLRRVAQSSAGTFGVLLQNKTPLCLTCEDPWNDNKTGISCVPAGNYKCVPHMGEKYKNVWRLEDVPGRSAILIHAGNTLEDTRGCILVGRSFAMFGNTPGVTNSKDALTYLQAKLPPHFELEIINP